MIAAMLTAAPAQAQLNRVSNPTDLFTVFKAICLDHFADSDAQIASALAAPQDFEYRNTGEDGTKRYWNERFALSILPKDGQRYCMVTAVVDPATTLADGGALLRPHLPGTVRKEPDSQTMIGWADRSDDNRLDSYFFTKRGGGDETMAAFAAARDGTTPSASAPLTN